MIIFKSSINPHLGLSKSPSMMVPTSNTFDTSEMNERVGLLKRSISISGGEGDTEDGTHLKEISEKITSVLTSSKSENGFTGSKVTIPKLDDDETFSKFFTKLQTSVLQEKEKLDVSDLDYIERSSERLASHKKMVQGPKRRQAAKNPLKALAARQDLQSEYTEIKTGVAEKELKRIKIEQSMCIEYFFMAIFNLCLIFLQLLNPKILPLKLLLA